MGHPSPDRFARIRRYDAKAKPEVIEAAKQLKCSVLQVLNSTSKCNAER